MSGQRTRLMQMSLAAVLSLGGIAHAQAVQCQPYPSDKKMTWDIRGPIDLGTAINALQPLLCRSFVVSHDLLKAKLRMSPTTTTPPELYRTFLAALGELGLTVQPFGKALEVVVDKSIECHGDTCSVDRALVGKTLDNMLGLASMARLVPSVHEGKPHGFKAYAVTRQLLLDRLGIDNGDTLLELDGTDLSTPDQAMNVFAKLRSATHVALLIERRGETFTMDYTIK